MLASIFLVGRVTVEKNRAITTELDFECHGYGRPIYGTVSLYLNQ